MVENKKAPIFDLQDCFVFGGLAVLGIGLAGFDWRVSLCVIGLFFMILGKGVLVIHQAAKKG